VLLVAPGFLRFLEGIKIENPPQRWRIIDWSMDLTLYTGMIWFNRSTHIRSWNNLPKKRGM